MRKERMTLHRFCSYVEFYQYMAGRPLFNHTDHYQGGKGGSTSKGFCFFMGDVNEWAQRLNGLVEFDVLLTVEVAPERVIASMGVYADWSKDDGHSMPPKRRFPEFCTECYCKEAFHFISADHSYRHTHISRSQVVAMEADQLSRIIKKFI